VTVAEVTHVRIYYKTTKLQAKSVWRATDGVIPVDILRRRDSERRERERV